MWLALWGTGAAWAQAQGAGDVLQAFNSPPNTMRTAQVQARLLAHAPQGVAAGKPLWLGLQLVHQPEWHTYWKNSGDSGQPTSLQWTLPAGLQAGDIAWPAPSRLPVPPLANYGYDGSVLLPVPVTVASSVAAGSKLQVQLKADWLVCKRECLPQQGRFTLELTADGQPVTADAAAFDSALATVPRPLPAQATATVEARGSGMQLRIAGLPASWQGKPVNLYPETPEILPPAADGEQGWQGGLWHIRLPLHPQRSESPTQLPLVLALRDTSATAGILRNLPGSPPYRVTARVEGQWPAAQAKAVVPAGLTAALQANAADESHAAGAATPATMTLWLALGGALLGGLILNLMPCVFPVLAIKVLTFAKHAHSPREQRLSGLAYTAGVVLSFGLLAALLLALRAAGEQLGWGFQLQNPWLVAALAGLFTLLGLNLAGVFHIGQVLPSRWMHATAQHPVTNALLSGVLAVLVASPCTAPFMGASLGYAIGLPAWQALLVFAMMGLGLALPVLAGSFFPGALRWLPRPGPWMDTFRTLMAFPMFATVIWLVWVLGHQSGMDGAAALLALLLCGSGLLWALGRHGKARWWLALLFAGLLGWLTAGYGQLIAPAAHTDSAATTSDSADGWAAWSPQRVQQALAAGQPVFVDYTAAWCVTCQVNKKMVLQTAAFTQAIREKNVLLLRADWTRSDAAITASLNQLGRNGVPLYVLHRPQAPQQPALLPEVLTLDAVRKAVQGL